MRKVPNSSQVLIRASQVLIRASRTFCKHQKESRQTRYKNLICDVGVFKEPKEVNKQGIMDISNYEIINIKDLNLSRCVLNVGL